MRVVSSKVAAQSVHRMGRANKALCSNTKGEGGCQLWKVVEGMWGKQLLRLGKGMRTEEQRSGRRLGNIRLANSHFSKNKGGHMWGPGEWQRIGHQPDKRNSFRHWLIEVPGHVRWINSQPALAVCITWPNRVIKLSNWFWRYVEELISSSAGIPVYSTEWGSGK